MEKSKLKRRLPALKETTRIKIKKKKKKNGGRIDGNEA